MHRFVAGTCRMELTLTPAETWIVRAGDGSEGSNRESTTRKDVRLKDADRKPVLPASSVKGVMRGTAERVLRSLHPGRDPSLIPLADATFGLPKGRSGELPELKRGEIADSFLQEWRDKQIHDPSQKGKLEAAKTYPDLSAASQLFGATLHAGLVTLDDVRLKTGDYDPRPHIAVDRFSGAVVTGATFFERLNPKARALTTTLTIENFAHWQLALLRLVVEEINDGYSTFGGGTRKGHGHMALAVDRLTFQWPGTVHTGERAGIISPQGWIAGQAEIPDDCPLSARRERDVSLMADRTAREDPTDWRHAGLVGITLDTPDDIAALFREAFEQAWLPWIEHMRQEVA
jgi:CRISPR/Cas system CSM-associated protein Csm3 (group 7 of RAMP superfamily)